ncbi:MAG: hypothetical protein QW763_03885 [Archaeoglobaceae archaeon]
MSLEKLEICDIGDVIEREKLRFELEFTGNWFIDAGILGFVNLMEEIYGWDLEELQERILKEPEVVYYGYFPLAYFYNLLDSKKKDEAKYKELKEKAIEFIEKNKSLGRGLLDKIWWEHIAEVFRETWVNKQIEGAKKENKLKLNPEEAKVKLNEIWSEIQKIKNENELKKYLDEKSKEIGYYLDKKKHVIRIPVDSGFYKNFLFFNNSKNILGQLVDLKNLIEGNINYSEYLSKLDKTLNKFLPSEEEFPNISYTEFKVSPLLKDKRFLFVYLLNFTNSFNNFGAGNYFFYAPDLNFAYKINKELRIKLKKIKSNEQKSKIDILKVTWESILDSIFETESLWILENMFIVYYKRIENQELVNVEYFGVSKLQATFILDDSIRENLNYYLKVDEKDYLWLIEVFTKNKPLLPIINRYIHLRLKDANANIPKFGKRKLLYPVLVDAKIREICSKKGYEERIFDDSFFDRFKRTVEEVKEEFKHANLISKSFSNLIDPNGAEKYAKTLFEFVRRSQKFGFVNLMLKILNQKREDADKTKDIMYVMNYLFEKVLNNEVSWRNFAVVFVVALLVGFEGGESDGDLDSENR